MAVLYPLKKRKVTPMAETIKAPTSPRLKPWGNAKPLPRFTVGLVGLFWPAPMVSQVDTFIEKPCSVSFLHRYQPVGRAIADQGGSILGHRKMAVSQLISFSVEKAL